MFLVRKQDGSAPVSPDLQTMRDRLINHILTMKQHDQDYARASLKSYHDAMPFLDLVNGVKENL